MKAFPIAVAALVFTICSASAQTYQYICKDRGELHPLKIDETKESIDWKGVRYKFVEAGVCGRMGWRVEKEGKSFEFCTATRGHAGFEFEGRTIKCGIKL